MPQETLDYQSPVVARNDPANVILRAIGIVAGAVLGTNSVLLAAALWDLGGWTDMRVMYLLGPLANALLLLLAVARVPRLKRRSMGRSIVPYVLASIGLPIAGHAADFLLITLFLNWRVGNL